MISDLFEGGDRDKLLKRAAAIIGSGVKMVTLVALSDQSSPSLGHAIGASFSAMRIPSFACTTDAFPDLMAAAMRGEDMEGHVAKMRSA